MLVFFNALNTGVGRVLGGIRWCLFFHSVIPCRMADIRLGAALLRSPQLERTFLSLSHFLYPL